MLSTLVSLTLLAGAHGLEAKDPVALTSALEARLPAWLKREGDRQAMLANPKEIDAFVKELSVDPRDRKGIAKGVLDDQKIPSDTTTFTGATRALVTVTGRGTAVHFFNATQRCAIGLIRIGEGAKARYVVTDGPLVDTRSLEVTADVGAQTTVTFLEKKNGVWTPGPLPRPGADGCNTALHNTAKTVFIAEKSYFAEFDRYETAADKLGLVLEDGAQVTITLENGGFTARVTVGDGVAQITDKSGQPTVLQACTK
jgi:hypothetical protein